VNVVSLERISSAGGAVGVAGQVASTVGSQVAAGAGFAGSAGAVADPVKLASATTTPASNHALPWQPRIPGS
jgi:hypothetical protein